MVKKVSKHKRVTSEGKIWYYYPKKKKLGRKKKRGPKKKKPEPRPKRIFLPWLYKIVVCKNKNQVKFVKRFHDEIEVEKYKQFLLAQNDEVILPVAYVNNGNTNKSIYDCTYEYVVLKKKDKTDIDNFSLPNKYGKLVPHISSNKNWIIWDKFPCLIEETFWVFGYNKFTDRKDISWIYNNLVLDNIPSKYNYLRLYVYNNKLVIRDDYNNIEIIICKNISDCIRLYNKLQNHFCLKMKNVIFSGRVKRGDDILGDIIALIREKTGWKDNDIYRTSTRH